MIHLAFTKIGSAKKVNVQVVRCLTIGRGMMADINLKDDDGISRLHTLVVPRPDGRIDVRDLCSSGGTFIIQRGERKRLMPTAEKGGVQEGRAILATGEKFFIGSYEVEVKYEEMPDDPTAHAVPQEEEDITVVDKIE